MSNYKVTYSWVVRSFSVYFVNLVPLLNLKYLNGYIGNA